MGLRNRKDLTTEEKFQVAQWQLQHQSNGIINNGAHIQAAALFGLSNTTVRNIWRSTKQQLEKGQAISFQSKKKGNEHRDKLVPDLEKIKSLPVRERTTIRKLASNLNVPKTVVGRWVKQKKLRAHINAIKHMLTEANKLSRLKFSLSKLVANSNNENFHFTSMHNTVHIDEKWFFITKTSNRFYLVPGEADPYRSCKSKRFITKVMFMAAVSRPHFSSDGEVQFDGKIGIFPFTKEVSAKKNSKNRAKGTLETKPIIAVTKQVIKDCLINQVIPAIKAKWPPHACKDIIIQQDNARPHIDHRDQDFIQAATSDGFNIRLECQPPNSPDNNVLDLGYFRSIQSLQDDKVAKNVEDLVKNVISSYEELSATCLNNVFLTLQSCMIEIMKVKGGNDYKIPHMNKYGLSRMGDLPMSLTVDKGLIRECLDFLMLPENDHGISYDVGALMHAFGY